MALLHPHSTECTNSELDLFQVPMTQSSIIGSEWVEYSPLSNIVDNASITFAINGNSETYIDLSQTLLHVQVKVTKDDGTLPKAAVAGSGGAAGTVADNIAPENLFLHSLFSDVHVFLNERSITPSSQNYGYKSYIQSLLTFGDSAKQSYLTSSLFYRDTAGKFDSFFDNDGFTKRAKLAQKGIIDMIGVVHVDICQQPRLLLNMVDLKFKFDKNRTAFCVHSDVKCKTEISSASLYLRKVKVIPELSLAQAKALQYGTAKYPITRSECTSFSIPAGLMASVQDHLFTGQVPKKVVIGFVEQKSFLGDFKKSPYNFKHFDLSNIGLYVDGSSVPHKALSLNFEENQYMRAYCNLFIQTNQWNVDQGNQISREDYPEGNCLFAYNLTPDLNNDANHFHLVKNSNLRLEFKFAKPLPETVSVIIYAEFQNLIEIDKNRTVIFDYSN